MRIDKISTIQLPEHPHLLWVQIHTDEGIVGTGETTPRVGAVKRVIHDTLSRILLGRDPRQVERLWHEMFHALHYHGYAGSEFRALSAVDLALWDIVGQIAGLPLYRLLGGECRERVPIYNTCVSYGAIRDREGFLHSPGELAESLVAEGIEAMKI